MRSKTSIAVSTLLMLSLAPRADAAQMLYTFQGTVTSVSDPINLIAADGITLGDTVTYNFLIDFGQDGSRTTYGGSTIVTADSATQDSFFVDYLGGDALSMPSSPLAVSGASVEEYNRGLDSLTGLNSILHTNSQNNLLSVTVLGGTFSGLQVGDAVRVDNRISYSGGTSFLVSNRAQLTNISPVRPIPAVPEPSSLALLGLGTLGMVGYRWRKKSGPLDAERRLEA